MGMSSSQARLLNLTARMHDIEYKAQNLEAQKLQMANESAHVYQEYENALNATQIEYKTIASDGSAQFKAATYNSLCTYNSDAGIQYALCDTTSNKVYVSQTIADMYNATISASDFALRMTGLTTIPTGARMSSDQVAQEANGDLTLNRGEHGTTTVTNSGITLTLTNPFIGSNYKYTVTSANDTNATFEFLDNGRLVISGDGLTINASNGQQDDIILLGSNNILNTNDLDDIVRVNSVYGFGNTYLSHGSGNKVNTGAGNDYISNYTSTTTNGGAGTDSYMEQFAGNAGTASSVETLYTNNLTVDNKDGWITQGGLGDCRYLSLINSLTQNGSSLTNYVTITQSGSNYTVKFKNYPGANKQITVSVAAINNADFASGDGDVRIIEYALNELLKQNEGGQNLETCDYNTLANYLLGSEDMGIYDTNLAFEQIWLDYQDGTISNIVVGTGELENLSEGIVGNHAYAVKNVTSSYVELINPWDDKDILRLSKSDFFTYFPHVMVFGESTYDTNIIYANVASSPTVSAVDEYNKTNNVYLADANSDLDKYNYYVRLYEVIKLGGGCITIDNTMLNSTAWLSNMISNGSVYIKSVNSNDEWYDTNVATNTNLQEVSNKLMLKKAEAKYEADMRKINLKDKKFDTDLAALDNERSAIKTEIETLKSVAKDNVDRTFKLFS